MTTILDTQSHIYKSSERYLLESGKYLSSLELEYTTFGQLNHDKSNVIWVCHALTANSNFVEWWPGIFGKGLLYDPEDYFVICVNIIGSCYGSTGPNSMNPETQKPYHKTFPIITNRDVAGTFDLLTKHLQLPKIHTLIGCSFGGFHALEWAIHTPEVIERLIVVAANAQASPWAIALNESQRMAIEQDPSWLQENPMAGIEGMKVARSIALLSYRNYRAYNQTQEDTEEKTDNYKAASYQKYQGEKLAKRFSAYSYWTFTKAMDSHNVGRGRGGVEEALAIISAKTHIIGIDSDILFPKEEQVFLAQKITNANIDIITSAYGHDGFLIEAKTITQSIRNFYSKNA